MPPPSATQRKASRNARASSRRASAHGAAAACAAADGGCSGRDRTGRRDASEHRHIAAERQIDHDGIVLAAIGVVARERAAQPHRLNAHDRIGLRIEIVGAPERLDRDGVALDAVGGAAQRRFDDIAKERDELRRAAERFARGHALERNANLVRTRGRPSTCVSTPGIALPLPSLSRESTHPF